MDKQINLERLLEWIMASVYDKGHGLLGPPSWVVSAEGLLDHLREQTDITKEKLGFMVDEARFRVWGGEE